MRVFQQFWFCILPLTGHRTENFPCPLQFRGSFLGGPSPGFPSIPASLRCAPHLSCLAIALLSLWPLCRQTFFCAHSYGHRIPPAFAVRLPFGAAAPCGHQMCAGLRGPPDPTPPRQNARRHSAPSPIPARSTAATDHTCDSSAVGEACSV